MSSPWPCSLARRKHISVHDLNSFPWYPKSPCCWSRTKSLSVWQVKSAVMGKRYSVRCTTNIWKRGCSTIVGEAWKPPRWHRASNGNIPQTSIAIHLTKPFVFHVPTIPITWCYSVRVVAEIAPTVLVLWKWTHRTLPKRLCGSWNSTLPFPSVTKATITMKPSSTDLPLWATRWEALKPMQRNTPNIPKHLKKRITIPPRNTRKQ